MKLLHISRAHYSETDEEKKQLAALDKYERKFLSQRECFVCEKPLNEAGCGAFFSDLVCDQETRIARRADALKKYKPRPGRRKDSSGR